jgi:inner membrane protein involved in colicin E2 resistance
VRRTSYRHHGNCDRTFFDSPSVKFFLNCGIVHAVLYGLIYLILRVENYAQPAGAILGFLTLAVVMFSTLRVDWSGRENPAPG